MSDVENIHRSWGSPRPRKSSLRRKFSSSSQLRNCPWKAGRKAITVTAATRTARATTRHAERVIMSARGSTAPGSPSGRAGERRRAGTRPWLLAAQQAGHFLRVEAALERVVGADPSLVDEALERLLHGEHAGGGARLEQRLDLERLALANQVTDGRGDHQHFHGEGHALVVPARDELLGEDGVQHVGELYAGLLLLVRREHVHDAVDALGGRLRVQGGEHEVARLRRGEGRLDGGHVAHLAHEAHVGILTQAGAERRRARQGVDTDFPLHHDARLVLEEVLDGILEGHDVQLALLVHAVEHRGEGGRLPLPRRARDEDQPALEPGELEHARGQAELLDGGNLVRDAAEGGSHARPLPEDIDAETGEAGDAVREVTVETLAKRLLLDLRHDGEHEGLALLGGEGPGLVGHQLASHAELGWQTALQANAGRVQLDSEAADGAARRD